jgi:hypothetical protein
MPIPTVSPQDPDPNPCQPSRVTMYVIAAGRRHPIPDETGSRKIEVPSSPSYHQFPHPFSTTYYLPAYLPAYIRTQQFPCFVREIIEKNGGLHPKHALELRLRLRRSRDQNRRRLRGRCFDQSGGYGGEWREECGKWYISPLISLNLPDPLG